MPKDVQQRQVKGDPNKREPVCLMQDTWSLVLALSQPRSPHSMRLPVIIVVAQKPYLHERHVQGHRCAQHALNSLLNLLLDLCIGPCKCFLPPGRLCRCSCELQLPSSWHCGGLWACCESNVASHCLRIMLISVCFLMS